MELEGPLPHSQVPPLERILNQLNLIHTSMYAVKLMISFDTYQVSFFASLCFAGLL